MGSAGRGQGKDRAGGDSRDERERYYSPCFGDVLALLLVFFLDCVGDFDSPLVEASVAEVPMMTMMYYIMGRGSVVWRGGRGCDA